MSVTGAIGSLATGTFGLIGAAGIILAILGFGVGWIHVYPASAYGDQLALSERVAARAVARDEAQVAQDQGRGLALLVDPASGRGGRAGGRWRRR